MVISHQIHGTLTVIFHNFVSYAVDCESLLEKFVTHIFFVFQNPLYLAFSPNIFAQRSQSILIHQRLSNIQKRVTVKVHFENHSHRFCFIGYDFRLTVIAFFVAKQMLVLECNLALTICFFLAPTDIFTN